MCGIYGHYIPEGIGDLALVERMGRRLAHRGPDGAGSHAGGPLAFGAGRLAIIDLAAPAGPIFSEDRRAAVAFNGEIYNYRALRAELEAQGHRFATHTDTEVIVHGYESWGEAVVERLRGMFALALWDAGRERLLLARDRLGEKPLYYAQLGRELLFASEIKALLEHPGLPRAVDDQALLDYLALGYVPAPLTLFRGVFKLPPGELLVADRDGLRQRAYWTPVAAPAARVSFAQAVEQVRAALVESVEMRLMSDVPIGAFLSGGVDSTAVTAIMGRALGRPVQTFTVGFEAEPGSRADAKFNVDVRYAALAAEHLRTEHHVIIIPPDERLARWLPHFVAGMDEPVAQQSIIQTAYVAALARLTGVPVLLSGDCGDELFLGYERYRADRLLERYLRLPALLREPLLTPLLERLPSDRLRKLARKSRAADPIRRYLEWNRVFDLERLPALLADARLAAGGYAAVSRALRPHLDAPRTPYFADRIAYAGLRSWIAEDSNMRVDKMSMLMSTESRAPFQDHRLVELALNLPLPYKLRGGDTKAVLKAAVADLVPRPILERPKWGFMPPLSEWLRTTFRPLVETYLAPERVAAAGYFQPEAVARLARAHLERQRYEAVTLFALLVFHLWHAHMIAGDLPLDSLVTPAELLPQTAPVRT